MLKHQRQGPLECVPTAVAMLLDIPKDSVIEAVMPDGCKSWDRLIMKPQDWWKAVEIMLDAGFGDGTGKTYRACVSNTLTYSMSACPEGKGLISITLPGQLMGHCVAFADGIVYDPEDDKPLEWAVWRHVMRDWHIRGILYL